MASGVQQSYGAVVGTGANLDVRKVGWRPREVRLVNVDSGDELYWSESMPDGAGVKRVAAGAATYVTTGGVTPLSDGFRLGTDGDMNVAGENVHFVAAQ